ncbi:hypothetical protein JCM11251_003239 [Rhodosporidiobolus azoricus]
MASYLSSSSAPFPTEDAASPTTSATSTTGPLSPELVQSLRIPWLNLDFPRFSSSPTPPSGSSSSSTSSSGQGSTALEQDTLAMRRMKAATARGRPPLFRRRSKSLDDADQADMEKAAREMRREQSRSASRESTVRTRERERKREKIRIATGQARETVLSPVTATSAASFTSSAATTTVPTTVTHSTFATRLGATTTGWTASPLPSGSVGLARSASEPLMLSPSLAPAPLDLPPVPTTQPIPQVSAFPPASHSAAYDSRLTSWVSSVSAAAALSSIPAPLPPFTTSSSSAPLSSSSATRSPGPGKLPLPPRQPYTPVLPSPLSTCSYTSGDGEDSESASGGQDGQQLPARTEGFPFPATPLVPSFAGASAHASSASEGTSSPAAHSVQSAPVTSPSAQLHPSPSYAHYIAGQRPPLQSFTSASTIANADFVAAGETVTATPSGANSPSIATVMSVPSPRLSRAASVSIPASSSTSISAQIARLPPPSRSATIASTSSSSASASASHPHPPHPRSHARTSSAASSSGRHAAPLTPPESLCTGPWLANASVSEMAWSDVLGAARGSNGSGGSGFSGSGGGGFGLGGGGFGVMSHAGSGGVGDARQKAGGGGGGGARGGSGGGKDEKDDGEGGKKPGGGELMGNAAPGSFAALVREKVGALVDEFLPEVAGGGEEKEEGEREEVVGVVEYGAVSSRSASLVLPILSHFASRQPSSPSVTPSTTPPGPAFQVTHASLPAADFRSLIALAEETYLRAPLAREDRVFSSFVARPFGAKVVPRGSVSVGFSCMSLHWPSTDRKFRVAPATLAHGELMAFLSARATEFTPSGLLVLAYIARSEEAAATASSPSSMPTTPSASPPLREIRSASVPSVPIAATKAAAAAAAAAAGGRPPMVKTASSPPTAGNVPRKKDIWAHMTSVIGQAIQRLVSTGLLKPQIARLLLALPLHPRTPRQTTACLRASAHSWDTLHSSIVTLSHPAWVGVEHGTVSPESWTDHTIQLLKIFWEADMRLILRESLGSRGACEWVLDCLWTVAKEKLEEAPPHPLDLEVQIVALRRRSSPPSVPASPATSTVPLAAGYHQPLGAPAAGTAA